MRFSNESCAGWRWALVAAAVVVFGGAGERLASAGITAVELSLDSVQSFAGSDGVLLRFEGTVLGAPLVQIDYPLHFLVFEQATGRYVRFDMSSGGVSGVAPQLLDGASASESLGLLYEGNALVGCEVVFVGEGRVDVQIPKGVLSGPLEAYAFALYEGDALMSNQVAVEATP